MKAYTDLRQSKELMKFLPPESADHFHIIGHLHTDGPRYEVIRQRNEVVETDKYWPCWSQAALYNILPVIIGNLLEENALRLRMDKGETNFNVWYDNLDTGCVEDGLDVVESNPVDAYFQMILILKEKNLL